ncbi:MAG: tRNA (adenosine(37)-N6)-dimethylallyltransferase MiaA [Victivallaceae bacterium]
MNTLSSSQTAEGLLQTELSLNKNFLRLFRNTVILLAGPTGVGKTDVSLRLAELLNGEIISADAMQVYQGMNIGTAKVSLNERQRIPHHLIDVRHVADPFNVVDFYYEARQACRAILNRGRVPIVVGGSGFYFHIFISGPPTGPPANYMLRKELEQELFQNGCQEMYRRLKEIDPDYANTITVNDRHKIIRAFEIITLTKMKVSDHRRHLSLENDAEYNYRAWCLTLPKEELYRRIEVRCRRMMQEGLLDEVKNLLSMGIKTNVSAEKAIGYRQWIDFLSTEGTDDDYKAAMEKFIKASRSYIKRQLTWFKKHTLFRPLDGSLMDIAAIADFIAMDYHLCS